MVQNVILHIVHSGRSLIPFASFAQKRRHHHLHCFMEQNGVQSSAKLQIIAEDRSIRRFMLRVLELIESKLDYVSRFCLASELTGEPSFEHANIRTFEHEKYS